ncbi:MAG: histidinol-phosphate transaminase [Gaiellales bacterium]
MGEARLSGLRFRSTLQDLVAYEPGRPVEDVQRELDLDEVVKLASNEGPFPPVPAALEAIARGAGQLNRYPDGGMYRLREALSLRHGVDFDQVVPAAGADGVVMYLSMAFLDPGSEIVCGWPSFPSYVLAARKLGGVPRTVPLDTRAAYDLDGLLETVTDRTRLVYVCNPNNPTGTIVDRPALVAFLDQVPPHVLTVIDEAYAEYVDAPGYLDGIEEAIAEGRQVVVLRTFSKIYGLAGLRIGYGVGPAPVMSELRKVQNAFDVTQTAQDAALASLDEGPELARRRAATASGRLELTAGLRALGLRVPDPVANFVYAEVGDDAPALADRLLATGFIVRPLAGFGAPEAIRVTVGTPAEQQAFLEALERCL